VKTVKFCKFPVPVMRLNSSKQEAARDGRLQPVEKANSASAALLCTLLKQGCAITFNTNVIASLASPSLVVAVASATPSLTRV
jgi:hypothetical protein